MPPGWELRSNIFVGDKHFSEDWDKKCINIGKIQSSKDLIIFLHEYGHTIFSANDDPELRSEAKKSWEESRFFTGQPTSLPPDKLKRTIELLARNERGASARALEFARILKQQGIDLKIDIPKQIKTVEDALDTYRAHYGSTKLGFKSGF